MQHDHATPVLKETEITLITLSVDTIIFTIIIAIIIIIACYYWLVLETNPQGLVRM